MNILGIYYGHNASVALIKNGEVVFSISEERLNRIKNSTGFPKLAVEYVREHIEKEIDLYVLNPRYSWGYNFFKKTGFTSRPYNKAYSENPPTVPLLFRIAPSLYHKLALRKYFRDNEIEERNHLGQEMALKYFAELLGVDKNKILFADHHMTHALSTVFFMKNPAQKTLVFTLDGEGDGLCATVNVWDGENMEVISRVNRAFSLGYLYREVTAFLGMKPDEHEFKVMGLSPYAKEEHVNKILPIFEKLLWLNKADEFRSEIPMPVVKYHLADKLRYQRFDNLAGALQKFTENIVTDWVGRWIKKTGIHYIAAAGGVFMNVKLNQKIIGLTAVSSFCVTPSAGDESSVWGTGLLGLLSKGTADKKIRPIRNLYLGNSYTDEEIWGYLEKNGHTKRYKVTKEPAIDKKIAELLARGEIVARLAGRMEFGARALGNRSILANPKNFENVHIINEMIKNRDFWMPFAASILSEDAPAYLYNSKDVNGSFMAITFDTTPLAHEHLQAALHPYDKTIRPQIVKKEDNPEYHSIISEFKKLTGIGGVLNTSFNLHGEPNVEKPEDALHTLEESGLKYLVIGSFLIEKK